MAKRVYVSVRSEDIHDDGSYLADVSVFGHDYAVYYVKGEFRVYGQASQYRREPAWKRERRCKIVEEFARARVELQGSAFQEAHRRTYSLAA